MIAGAAALVIVIVLAVVLILTNSGGASAKDTAEDFIAAAKARDCDKALSLISDDLKKREDANCDENADSVVPPQDTDITFGEVTVQSETDSTATAKVDATVGEQTLPLTIKLVKQDGDWKVDQIG